MSKVESRTIVTIDKLDKLDREKFSFVSQDNAVKLFGTDILHFSYNGKITGSKVKVDLSKVLVWGIGFANKGKKFYCFPICPTEETNPYVKLGFEYLRETLRNDANGISRLRTDDEKITGLKKKGFDRAELERLIAKM